MKAVVDKDFSILTPVEKPSNTKPLPLKVWGTAGAFLFSNLLLISVQEKYHLFSFRKGNFDDDFLSISYRVKDLALLYGIASKKKWICASATLGPSLVTVSRYSDSRFGAAIFGGTGSVRQISEHRCIGLAYQFDFAVTPLSFLGFGIYFTGNYNKEQSVAGLGISIRLGKLR